ncbi:hypothetical protein ABEB36_009183 [Hypothenemus hampei]|uniref:Neuropeptide-like 1 n=1 Tax=Hypothenemus hampei TaxID=57062 RepID=A0ABD1ESE3_HYPHA
MGSLGLIQLSMWCILVGFALIDNKVNSDNSYDFDTAEALRILLLPEENDSIQVQALRRQLLKQLSNLLQPNVEFAEQPDDGNYRRTLASLDLWNDLPEEHKRNIEALARSGMACRMFPELEPQDSTYKRSIEILAKNGQHPLVRQPIENQKRGIEALARNGDLHRPPNYQIQQGNMDYKRNLANLARTYNFPVSNGQSYGKRSLGSLAKNGELPFRYGKRNIQSLARDGVIGKRSIDSDDSPLDKRNIQSLKQRNKRQADYFENEMVYQIPITDYEDYLQELSSQGSYPVEDKRFLGRIPQMGKPKTTAIPKARRYH